MSNVINQNVQTFAEEETMTANNKTIISSISRMMMILGLFFAVSLGPVASASLPFSFGNATNDTFTPPTDFDFSRSLALPIPLAPLGRNAAFVVQTTHGTIRLEDEGSALVSYFYIYNMDLDTSRGGVNQNEVWLRVGRNSQDLNLARDIIAGNGTDFTPQSIIVATWFKVERSPQVVGAQNTFQLALAWGGSGETWAIYAYSQLEFFSEDLEIGFTNDAIVTVGSFFTIRDNTTMTEVLNGTNCNRSGVYAFPIRKGGPTSAPTNVPTNAPSTSPSKAPTAAPTRKACGLLGWSIFCPFTLCGIFGRWLGFCQST